MLYGSFLAPIDGYTNLPFRLLCQKYGAEAACVPLVNATAIARNADMAGTVDAHADEKNLGVQLVGNDPDAIGLSTRAIMERFPFVSWLNLNCGCPSVRTRGSGGGSALLAHPERIVRSVLAMQKAGRPVSVKLRIKDSLEGTAAICRRLEESGVDFIIIHGRTPGQGYSGKADWELIRALRERLEVPIVGNGDITSASEGKRRVEGAYCDSFMVGRAAMGNPMLFCDRKPALLADRFAMLRDYLSIHMKYAGEPQLSDVKMKAVNFMSGSPDASLMRNKICRAKSIEEILALDV
jgi:tRNA-dihydrouridine synthase B